jgi:hypothetical protein
LEDEGEGCGASVDTDGRLEGSGDEEGTEEGDDEGEPEPVIKVAIGGPGKM